MPIAVPSWYLSRNQYPPKFLSHNIYAQGLIFLPGQFNTTVDWLTIYQVNLHGPRNKNILVQWFRGGNLNHSWGSGLTKGLMIYIQFDAPWQKEHDISGLGVGILKMFSRYLVISCSKGVKITPGDQSRKNRIFPRSDGGYGVGVFKILQKNFVQKVSFSAIYTESKFHSFFISLLRGLISITWLACFIHC